MKTKLIAILIISTATIAIAIMTTPFQGWDWTVNESKDIIIARCSETPQQTVHDKLVKVQIKVTAILKGTNSLGPAFLYTEFPLRQNEDYLLLADLDFGSYYAVETYRVIPLGLSLDDMPTESFDTVSIAGKPLDEQLQILYKRSIGVLDRQIKEDQEKKALLEQAINR